MSAAEEEIRAGVAIVDDDEESASLLQEFLEGKGFSVVWFAEAEPLLVAKPHRFAAMLLDINLPGMWGSECGFHLRCGGYTGPIIAISGNIELWEKGDLQDLGFTCALGKPVNLKQLINLLRKHIRQDNKAD